MLDMEKAYDRVHPGYLSAVLSKLGFSERLVRIIDSLFFRTKVTINLNGHLAPSFTQRRGLRQGDPLSPLLFNVALEPLLRSMDKHPGIRGIQITPASRPVPFTAYADDVLLYLNDPMEWHRVRVLLT